MDGIPSLRRVDRTPQLGVIHKLLRVHLSNLCVLQQWFELGTSPLMHLVLVVLWNTHMYIS